MPESIASLPLDQFLARLSAKTPTPGGGAAAGVAGAIAAAQAGMVVSYSLGKKSLTAHQPTLEAAAAQLDSALALMLRLADEDAAAYGLVNELQRLPEGDPKRAGELPAALNAAVQVPLASMAVGVTLLELCVRLAPVTNPQLRSDLAIAAVLADASVRAGAWNVGVNLTFLGRPDAGQEYEREMEHLIDKSGRLLREIEVACGKGIFREPS